MTVTLTYRRLPHRLGMRWGCTSHLTMEPGVNEQPPQDIPITPPHWKHALQAPPASHTAWISESDNSSSLQFRLGQACNRRLGIPSDWADWPRIVVMLDFNTKPQTWWTEQAEGREQIIAWLTTLPVTLEASYTQYLREQLRPWLEANAAAPGDDEDTVIVVGPAALEVQVDRPRKRRHIQVQEIAA